ncbi:unnamed protein product [Lactuca saligna]|uniref:Arabidopsis retrotransposon Orf1 C-terminal domain-containing protein n=1 Tax=Lactuca saligna TaxID=75948 RepID=A0AA36EBG2_LACSI|nr:unnamed protein product [Lactuca saligna]
MSLEDIVKSLATSTQAFHHETKASITNLEKQVSQLATSVSKLESQGKLPAQTETNPRHNVCAITLRGGKSYDGPKVSVDHKQEEIVVEEATKEEKKEEKTVKKKPFITESKATPAPFPERLRSLKKEREESEIMQMFKRVQINIPLLEVIKQVPRYARFLKDLCVSKKKLKGNQVITVGEHVSAVLQKRMPPKCKDPGVFTVPCKLGNLHVPRAMLDLAASVNFLPYSLFKSIGVGTLRKTGVIIQLADRSLVHPKGVLEDVLVQVDEFIFPADFYVLDMGDDDSPSSSSILLGRPFLKTSKTKIDVYNGTLSMEFDDEVINFNVNEEKKVPSDVPSVNFVNMIQQLAEKCLNSTNNDFVELVLSQKLDRYKAEELAKEGSTNEEVLEILKFKDDKHMWIDGREVESPTTKAKFLPPVEQAQDSGAKTPPGSIKQIHVEKESTQPVINSIKLSKKEETTSSKRPRQTKSSARRRKPRTPSPPSRSPSPPSRSPTPPADPSHCGVVCFDPIQQGKLESFLKRGHAIQKFVHVPTLKELHVYNQVKTLFRNIGWHSLLRVHELSYKVQTTEFLSSVYLDHGVLYFRIMNQDYEISLDQINAIVGAPTENTFGPTDPIQGYFDMTWWNQLTQLHPYVSSATKASSLIHPVIKVAHRIIASLVAPKRSEAPSGRWNSKSFMQ